MQRRVRTGLDNRVMNPAIDKVRAAHFRESLCAIARADGITTSEELEEILAIVEEFGLTGDAPPVSD